MGKSRDLTEFERGMIVGVRMAGKSITETVDILGFSRTAVSRIYREWCEKKITSTQRQASGRKRLVDEDMLEKVVEENSQATCEQIRALYNNSVKTPISHRTIRRTLKRLGYSCKTPPREDLTLALAGLEALAAYTTAPLGLGASRGSLCSIREDPSAGLQAYTDSECSKDNASESASPSSGDSAQ